MEPKWQPQCFALEKWTRRVEKQPKQIVYKTTSIAKWKKVSKLKANAINFTSDAHKSHLVGARAVTDTTKFGWDFSTQAHTHTHKCHHFLSLFLCLILSRTRLSLCYLSYTYIWYFRRRSPLPLLLIYALRAVQPYDKHKYICYRHFCQ